MCSVPCTYAPMHRAIWAEILPYPALRHRYQNPTGKENWAVWGFLRHKKKKEKKKEKEREITPCRFLGARALLPTFHYFARHLCLTLSTLARQSWLLCAHFLISNNPNNNTTYWWILSSAVTWRGKPLLLPDKEEREGKKKRKAHDCFFVAVSLFLLLHRTNRI